MIDVDDTYRPAEVDALTVAVAVAAVGVALGWVARVRAPPPGSRIEVVSRAPLDLNGASLAALTALPGVGRARAARLIGARPLVCWHDVERVLGVRAAARIRPYAGLGSVVRGRCRHDDGSQRLTGPRSSPAAGGGTRGNAPGRGSPPRAAW